MRRIIANKEEIFSQFEFNSMEMIFYLDTKTGEIVCTSDLNDEIEGMKETCDLLESDPERFVAFPDQDSRRGYDEMADFVDTIKDDQLVEKLAITLNGRGCFGRFKDVLLDYPEERERWFEFEEKRRREHFEEWLEDEEIEIVE